MTALPPPFFCLFSAPGVCSQLPPKTRKIVTSGAPLERQRLPKDAKREPKVSKCCLVRPRETYGIYCTGATCEGLGGHPELFFSVKPSQDPPGTRFEPTFSCLFRFWVPFGRKVAPKWGPIIVYLATWRPPFCTCGQLLASRVATNPPNRRKITHKGVPDLQKPKKSATQTLEKTR